MLPRNYGLLKFEHINLYRSELILFRWWCLTDHVFFSQSGFEGLLSIHTELHSVILNQFLLSPLCLLRPLCPTIYSMCIWGSSLVALSGTKPSHHTGEEHRICIPDVKQCEKGAWAYFGLHSRGTCPTAQLQRVATPSCQLREESISPKQLKAETTLSLPSLTNISLIETVIWWPT